MHIRKEKYEKIQILRKQGTAITDIAQRLFQERYSWSKSARINLFKELNKICKGIKYIPAWKRLFR